MAMYGTYGVQFAGCIANVVDDDEQPVTVDLSLSPIHGSARCVRSSLLIRRSCRFPEHSRLNVRDGRAVAGSVTRGNPLAKTLKSLIPKMKCAMS